LETLSIDQNKLIAIRAKAILVHIKNKIYEQECSETVFNNTLLPVDFELELNQNLTHCLGLKKENEG
jgi:hypothetical protein